MCQKRYQEEGSIHISCGGTALGSYSSAVPPEDKAKCLSIVCTVQTTTLQWCVGIEKKYVGVFFQKSAVLGSPYPRTIRRPIEPNEMSPCVKKLVNRSHPTKQFSVTVVTLYCSVISDIGDFG